MPLGIHLTEGAIARLSTGESQAQQQQQGVHEVKPVLQVADVRLVNASDQIKNTSNERYRLLLSDGVHLQQGMLSTQRNDLVRSHKFQIGSIVQLTQFVCNLIHNRVIIIIIDLDVILEKCDLIGDPKLFPVKADNVASSVAEAYQFGDVSATENLAGGNYTQPPVMDHLNTSSYSSNSYFSGSHDSGRYGSTTAAPTYHGTGISRPPANYLRQPQPSYQQPPPTFMNRAPIAKNEASPRITPIAGLNPYQGRWTIKARVTAKGELRLYSNTRGDGKVFSFDLVDADGGQIRVTCFNMVADQFHDQIEAGKVYMISKGTLKPAQKAFNHLPIDHEIMLDSTSIVQPCFEDDKSIPHQQFHFRPISDIEIMDKDSVVDIMGIVSSISPCSTIMRKNGTETQKRNLHIKDMSCRSIEFSLWGHFANAEGQRIQDICDSGGFPVVAVKSGRVNDYNGKSASTLPTSQLFIEPDFPEAHKLKSWFDQEGKDIPFVSLSQGTMSIARTDVRKTIAQIKDERLGTSEKPDWIKVCVTLKFVKGDSFCYTACPINIGDRQCSKKVTSYGDGKWRCDRCDKTVGECEYKYNLQLQIQDHTGEAWVTAFQQCGDEIMGVPAKELYFIKYEEQDEEKFAEVMHAVLFTKYIFTLRVKEDTYNNEQRVKSTVVKAERLNLPAETRYLLDMVDMMKTDNAGSLLSKTEHVTLITGIYGSGFGVGSSEPATAVPNYGGNAGNFDRDSGVYGSQSDVYESQYGGSRVISTTSSAGMYVSCNGCGGTGHNSMNCPRIINTQGQPYAGGFGSRPASGVNASTDCFKCHQFGHWAKDCPGLANGSANVTYSMYGGIRRQRVGGF